MFAGRRNTAETIADAGRDAPTRSALPRLAAACRGTVARFLADTGGVTAIQFALMLIPILMLSGASLSFSEVWAMRQRLNAAADQAALAAVDYGMMMQSATVAQAAAVNQFQSQADQVQAKLANPVSVVVTDSLTARTVVVSYTATLFNPFNGLFGTDVLTFSGSSTSTTNLPVYMDFYLLLDNSPSMAIAATQDGISQLISLTTGGVYKNTSYESCAFACHETDLSNSSPYNLYQLAKSQPTPIDKRIDVVRKATQSLMDTATATEVIANQYRAAVYTFGPTAQSIGLTTIASLTSNLSSVKTASASIDVMTVPKQNYNNDQDTDLNGMLTAIKNVITTAGDGSLGNPSKVVFIVSDGVSDAAYGSACTKSTTNGTRCQEPINTAYCTAIKNKFPNTPIRIAVLYTTYYDLTPNGWYGSWIAPFQSEIATNMQACASDGLYFEVSPTGGISAAMNALFQKAVGSARITK